MPRPGAVLDPELGGSPGCSYPPQVAPLHELSVAIGKGRRVDEISRAPGSNDGGARSFKVLESEVEPRDMTRTPEEVFTAHGEAFGSQDPQKIVANYAEDAVFVTSAGVQRGKDGVKQAFTTLFADLPDAQWEMKTIIFADDILLLEWAAKSTNGTVDDGVDTFVFRDGLIQSQTVRYTLRGV
jgi:hypothetical protein